MNKLSLRLRLIVCFIGISCVVWLAAGVLSWKETKEKVDEFFDTYQMALARQLAGADWSGLAAGAQKITDRMIENVHNADDEDEAIGFAVFTPLYSSAASDVYKRQMAKILAFCRQREALSGRLSTVTTNGGLSGCSPRTANFILRSVRRRNTGPTWSGT